MSVFVLRTFIRSRNKRKNLWGYKIFYTTNSLYDFTDKIRGNKVEFLYSVDNPSYIQDLIKNTWKELGCSHPEQHDLFVGNIEQLKRFAMLAIISSQYEEEKNISNIPLKNFREADISLVDVPDKNIIDTDISFADVPNRGIPTCGTSPTFGCVRTFAVSDIPIGNVSRADIENKISETYTPENSYSDLLESNIVYNERSQRDIKIDEIKEESSNKKIKLDINECEPVYNFTFPIKNIIKDDIMIPIHEEPKSQVRSLFRLNSSFSIIDGNLYGGTSVN